MDRFLLSSLWGTPVFRRAVTAKGGETGLPANGEEVSFPGTIEGDGGKLSSSYPSPGSANSDRGFAPCGTRRSVRRRYALDENERTTAGNPKPRGSPFLSGEGGLFGRISFVLQREHGISFALTFRNPFTFLGIPSLKTGGISFRAIMSSHLTRVYSIILPPASRFAEEVLSSDASPGILEEPFQARFASRGFRGSASTIAL